jgi:hypothetical protein
MAERRTEIRFEVAVSEVAVLDGYCQATGKDRTTVIREVLGTWSKEKLHVATIVCRVAGVNPLHSESNRNE